MPEMSRRKSAKSAAAALTGAAGLIAEGAGAALADIGAKRSLVMAAQKLHAAFKTIDDRVPQDEDLDDNHPLWQAVDAAYDDLLAAEVTSLAGVQVALRTSYTIST